MFAVLQTASRLINLTDQAECPHISYPSPVHRICYIGRFLICALIDKFIYFLQFEVIFIFIQFFHPVINPSDGTLFSASLSVSILIVIKPLLLLPIQAVFLLCIVSHTACLLSHSSSPEFSFNRILGILLLSFLLLSFIVLVSTHFYFSVLISSHFFDLYHLKIHRNNHLSVYHTCISLSKHPGRKMRIFLEKKGV